MAMAMNIPANTIPSMPGLVCVCVCRGPPPPPATPRSPEGRFSPNCPPALAQDIPPTPAGKDGKTHEAQTAEATRRQRENAHAGQPTQKDMASLRAIPDARRNTHTQHRSRTSWFSKVGTTYQHNKRNQRDQSQTHVHRQPDILPSIPVGAPESNAANKPLKHRLPQKARQDKRWNLAPPLFNSAVGGLPAESHPKRVQSADPKWPKQRKSGHLGPSIATLQDAGAGSVGTHPRTSAPPPKVRQRCLSRRPSREAPRTHRKSISPHKAPPLTQTLPSSTPRPQDACAATH